MNRKEKDQNREKVSKRGQTRTSKNLHFTPRTGSTLPTQDDGPKNGASEHFEIDLSNLQTNKESKPKHKKKKIRRRHEPKPEKRRELFPNNHPKKATSDGSKSPLHGTIKTHIQTHPSHPMPKTS